MPIRENVEIPFKNLSQMIGNPRKISTDKLEALKSSLLRFGYVSPIIVDERDVILGGNQRYLALKEVIENPDGLIQVVRVSGLSEDDKKGLNIALNNISGENDEEMLSQWLAELEEGGYDFHDAGLDELINIYDDAGEPEIDDEDDGELEDVDIQGEVKELENYLILTFEDKDEYAEAVELFAIRKGGRRVSWKDVKGKVNV